MNPIVITYLLYLIISIGLTVWVAQTLFKNGRLFLVDVFHGNEPPWSIHLCQSLNPNTLGCASPKSRSTSKLSRGPSRSGGAPARDRLLRGRRHTWFATGSVIWTRGWRACDDRGSQDPRKS